MVSIGSRAFQGLSQLTRVEIPDTVVFIGAAAFSECTGLTTVSIPNGVRYIDWGAFDGCTGLTAARIPASVEEINSEIFNNVGEGFTIYGDAGSYAEEYAASYGYAFVAGELPE